MNRLVQFALGMVLLGCIVYPTQAEFTSLYVFGDGACTTTNNPYAGPYYYGLRYSNGRVWVEVLAERQGLSYDPNNNWSYFGHDSSEMILNVYRFTGPMDAPTALFVVWACNADFVEDLYSDSIGSPNAPNNGTNMTLWSNAINQSLTNHWNIITTLYYEKDVRSLIMPNAVDIGRIPAFNAYASTNFVRQRVIEFNAALAALLSQARAALPGLTIYEPDLFSLLDDVLAHSGQYGLTNALDDRGLSIDVLADPHLANKSLTGPGTNYIFWDDTDPTAKFHAIIADVIQQAVSPVRITSVAALGSSNRLDTTNLPIHLAGFVDCSTNCVNWAPVAAIPTNAPPTIYVPASGRYQFYRLRFPFAWSWP